jgi:hypothetical protein
VRWPATPFSANRHSQADGDGVFPPPSACA